MKPSRVSTRVVVDNQGTQSLFLHFWLGHSYSYRVPVDPVDLVCCRFFSRLLEDGILWGRFYYTRLLAQKSHIKSVLMFEILLGFWTIRACLSDYWIKFSVLKAVAVLPTSPLKFPLLCSIHIWQVNRYYYVLRGKVFSVYLLHIMLTKWRWKVSGKWNVNLSCNVQCLLRFLLGFRTQNCIGGGDWSFLVWVQLTSAN